MRQWRGYGAIGFSVMLIQKGDVRAIALALALLAAPAVALAQTDEIQVYNPSIADKGKFNLMLHNNFLPNGPNTPAFAIGVYPDRAYIAVGLWGYGLADWFQHGLYLATYRV